MHRKTLAFSICLAILVLSASESRAQVSLGSTSFLDRVLHTEDTSQPPQVPAEAAEPEVEPEVGFLSISPAGAGEGTAGQEPKPATPTPFWALRSMTLNYQYEHITTKGPADKEADRHHVFSELSLFRANGFGVILGARYVRGHDEDLLPSSVDSNSYVLTVNTLQDLFQLFMKDKPDPTKLSLVFGTLLGYRHSDAEGTLLGADLSSDIDALIVVPTLSFTKQLTERLTFAEILLFSFDTSDTRLQLDDSVTNDDGNNTYFGLQFALKIKGPKIGPGNVTLTPSAQWNHDVHEDAQGIVEEWAEFVVKTRWPVMKGGDLLLQYTLDTFRSDDTGHLGLVGFECFF